MSSLDGWSIKKNCDTNHQKLENYILVLGRKLLNLEKQVEGLLAKEKKNAKPKKVRTKVQKGK